MPRKKQVVQKQKRRKVYRPEELSGDAHTLKPRGAFRVFTNYKLFAIIGAVALTVGFVFSAYQSTQGNATSSNAKVRGSGVVRTTPVAGSTSTTGAQPSIKQYQSPPPMTIDPNKTYTATIKTDKGDLTIELLPKQAPDAVNNFVFLAKDGFYNGSTFFRVIPGFVAQAGDPTGTGSGGPGYDLPPETTADPIVAGVVAMARPSQAGAPNNGSQFFVALANEPTLDGKNTVFGRVTAGLDVLKNLQARDAQATKDPPLGTKIDSITITTS
ncbi:MAG TPA: peptidylprolyl isomerase [Dehalococcoidia bacterium]|nr:peptidylprolyl isomerase [Dehalococcoidia bacterium]